MTSTESRPRPRRRRRPSNDEFDHQPRDWTEYPCWIVSRIDDLNVRSRPSRDSERLGQIDEGEYLAAECEARDGDQYRSCGGSHWWIPVYFRRRRCYVAWACVEWYSESGGAGLAEDSNPD